MGINVKTVQTSFTSGEWSAKGRARSDLEKYGNSVEMMRNMVPMVQGGTTRRGGTQGNIEAKVRTEPVRILGFEYNVSQTYIIELGGGYTRFIRDRAQLESSGSPYEISSPYLSGQVFGVRYAQSADVLFSVYPLVRPYELRRLADTNWQWVAFDFEDGPYLDTNSTAVTLALSGTSGSVNVTASAITAINNGEGFKTTDIGRLIRWKDPAGNWTWLEITAWTSTTVVVATIRGPNASAGTATASWRLGAWSDTTGWPEVITFHQGRLWFAATNGSYDAQPQTVWSSNSDDFTNFAPSAADGTVSDANSIVRTLSDSQVNGIRAMRSDDRGLLIWTTGGEWVGFSDGGLHTPSDFRSKKQSRNGSTDLVQPVEAGDAYLYFQRAGKNLHELVFSFETDRFRSPDLSILSEHMFSSQVADMAFQRMPDRVLWVVLGDGSLLSLTYRRDEDVVAWAKHTIGGSLCVVGSGGDATVEPAPFMPTQAYVYLTGSSNLEKFDLLSGASQWSQTLGGLAGAIDVSKDADVLAVPLHSGVSTRLLTVRRKSDGVETQSQYDFINSNPNSVWILPSNLFVIGMTHAPPIFWVHRYDPSDSTRNYAVAANGATTHRSNDTFFDRPRNLVYACVQTSGASFYVARYDMLAPDGTAAQASEDQFVDADLANSTSYAVFADGDYVIVSVIRQVGAVSGRTFNLVCYDKGTKAKLWDTDITTFDTANVIREDPTDTGYVWIATDEKVNNNPTLYKVSKADGSVADSVAVWGGSHIRGLSVGDRWVAAMTAGGLCFAYEKGDLSTNIAHADVKIVGGGGNVGLFIEETPLPITDSPVAFYGDADFCDSTVGSVATIPKSNGSDEVWLLVKRRTADGKVRQFIEYITDPFDINGSLEDAIHVDASVSYDGAATTTISVPHLEGQDVQILADGKVHPSKKVGGGGTLTLEYEATKVVVGLPYLARCLTQPVVPGRAPFDPRDRFMKAAHVDVHVLNSCYFKYGEKDKATYVWTSQKGGVPLFGGAPLFTGRAEPDSGYAEASETLQLDIQIDVPLPLTILQIGIDVEIGGNAH